MAVLLAAEQEAMKAWQQALLALAPDLDIRLFPDIGDAAAIEVALLWTGHDLADLRRYPNLGLIISMGAGVDHLLTPPGPPPGVAVARLVDRRLTQAMTEWVLLNVLRFHRQDPAYRAQQAARIWRELPAPDTAACRIGIMGLGALGQAAAQALLALGFPVMGWSRRPKSLAGVETYSGPAELFAMAARSRILVCLLPLTAATRGIINARLLASMPPGGYLLNAGRGGHQIAQDVLAALDSGHLAGAALDVFEPEPLPPDSPFWTHPKVVLTPHAASITVPESAAPQVIENIHRLRRGEPLLNLIDLHAGY